MIQITEKIFISEQELIFTADRSSGPGGQNVNKVSTRVTLMFDVKNSPGLHLAKRTDRTLSTRINKEGVLRIVSQQTRSQAENRALAVERFVELLKEALKKDLPRKKTKIPLAAKRRRLDEKKHQSRKKQQRSSRIVEE